jgi:hypothetical protein
VLSVVVRIIEHVFRSFQYVLYPTARQRRGLEHLLAVQCEAYNAALEERREAFKRRLAAGQRPRLPPLQVPMALRLRRFGPCRRSAR